MSPKFCLLFQVRAAPSNVFSGISFATLERLFNFANRANTGSFKKSCLGGWAQLVLVYAQNLYGHHSDDRQHSPSTVGKDGEVPWCGG